MASSSSSTFLTYGLKYHVFISFRGPDTRMGFTGHLYDALRRNGMKVFFDEEELEKGEEINPALDKAIQESWIVLVIFSINYAYSSWCLEELAKVMEYSKDKNMLVLPVFYKVNPSDLRHEKGIYAEALAKHECRYEKWKIDRWRLALHKAAELSGWHFVPGQMYEHKVIAEIVQSVSKRVRRLLDDDKSIDQHDDTKWRNEKTERLTLPGTEDRIVVYFTSLRGIRKTYEDCSKVRMILNNLGVAVDERDINLNSSYKKELQNALGNIKVSLPQVFIRGKYIGNADIMEKLNESGVLEKLLKGFPTQYTKNDCAKCGNARFVSCLMCSGKWKVMNMCQYCNENGLMRCPSCCS